MAIHWTIPFRSLRSGTDYQVNIYDASYSGNPIPLKGGSQPFTTEEENTDDMFTPLRLQSGYLRIVDDGKDANGNAFNWKTLCPSTDLDRPVTLTKVSGNTETVMWQGFMQAQNFSGELYNPIQEREFPVQCCLSVLSSVQVSASAPEPRTFAYLLKACIDAIPQHSITNIVAQGGADAQAWLLKMFDWRNLLDTDEDDELTAKYNLQEALEDLCRFWGWTARTKAQTLYLMCADDSAEQTILTMTYAQLTTMAGGTSAGTTSGSFSTTTISGDVFASVENDDMMVRGFNKCVVKCDVNQQDSFIKFAPASVQKLMEEARTGDPSTGYTWFNFPGLGDEPGVGYYSTARLASFDVSTLKGSCSSLAGFYRRQIYSSVDDDTPKVADEIAIWGNHDGNIRASLETKTKMMYTGGSLTISGSIWHDAHKDDNYPTTLYMRVGIGETKASAKWWQLHPTSTAIVHEWTENFVEGYTKWAVSSGDIKGSEIVYAADDKFVYKTIPCDTPGLYGYLYIDIYGCMDVNGFFQSFEIADLEVKYSLDTVYIPTLATEYRQRKVTVERTTSRNYQATNNSNVDSPFNIDCIYASDNNLKYGLGLVLNNKNSFMGKLTYNGSQQYAEQHLANRVANYWATSKRKITGDFRKNTIADIAPDYKVTLDGSTLYPVAISHDWRDDIINLTLLQI